MIDADLRTLLLADATVAGMVGTRIYPLFVPQDSAFPAIRYQRLVTPRTRSLLGPSGLAAPTFQYDCYGEQPSGVTEAKLLAEAVRHVLDGYRGTAGASFIEGAMVVDERDLEFEEKAGLARASLDVKVWHRES
jgi:hypothetical protein